MPPLKFHSGFFTPTLDKEPKFKAAYMPVCESGVYTIENVAVAEGDTVQCLVWKWDGANNRVTTVCDDAVTLK